MKDLILRKPSVPLRGYPPEDLDKELDKFADWVTDLLGLTGEQSARRMVTALPYVKQHFWSMGLGDVKKAFEMYALGQLKTQPRTNYFDVILVGKIFNEYRDQKPRPKTPVVSNEEISEAKKAEIMTSAILRLFNEFEETGDVGPGNTHIYDHLDETGEINLTPAQKWEYFEQAKKNNKKSASILDKVVNGPERATVEAKRLALVDWLKQRENKGLSGK